jgi:hypothetical protein
LKKLPNDLMRIVGSFLAKTPESIQRLNERELIHIFGRHFIEDMDIPPPPQ